MRLTKRIANCLLFVLAIIALAGCIEPTEESNKAPVFAGVGDATVVVGDTFDVLAGVTANDAEDGNLTSSIVVTSNNVNTSFEGVYTVVYAVKDSEELSTVANRKVTVVPPSEYKKANYLSGVDLSKLPASEKSKLFAAAERYLLENVYGGVPIYSGAARVMYSDRTQLFSETYNGVMGFGVAFSQFSQDDSHVKMLGETYGNAGEYTYRSSFNTDPKTLNPWIADDSNSSDFIDLFSGGLYDAYFDASKLGFEILPSLAAAEPIAVHNPKEINGQTYSTTWRIPIKDNLKWTFHPGINTAALPAGYDVLNVQDYLWTWRTAMENNWFRARTGGGDFISQGIKGASKFIDGKIPWSEVGIRLADGTTNTIEIEFLREKSAFEVKYGFMGGVLQPICKELYDAVGGEAGYGKTPTTVAASGIYYMDKLENGALITYKKNPLHPDAALYHYTGQQFRYINGSENIFMEFLAGRLDGAGVPSARVTEFENDPRVKVSSDPTTWRIMINGFGSVEARNEYQAQYPQLGLEDYEPEPILAYKEMRQALYYGFNREYAAVNVVKTYLPAHTLFTSTYFLDGNSALGVRADAAGQAVFDDFAGETFGYVPQAAKDLFKAAVAKGIAAGDYVKGTASNYTEIVLDFVYASSGSTAAQAMVAEIKRQYEGILVDDVNFVKIIIDVNDVAFPNNYYDYMMVANCDLGLGGISGSLLDAPSFLDVFNDDNYGGFTLNWGIDTHTANVEVSYVNNGITVYETWSYNALVAALNRKVYIKDGVEQKAFASAEALVNAYIDMAGEEKLSSGAAADIAEALYGDLEDYADSLDYDLVIGIKAITVSGNHILFVIGKIGNDYELIEEVPLYQEVEVAIGEYFASEGVALVNYTLLDETTYVSNPYLVGHGFIDDYPTLADIEYEFDFAIGVYATTWYHKSTGDMDDAVIVAFVDGYYIFIEWL